MNPVTPDPVRIFEHTHDHLRDLSLEIAQLLDAGEQHFGDGESSQMLGVRLEELRDELLDHFANEEEGLFPFIRMHFPLKTGSVDRLEAAHDAICGIVVRLAHQATREGATGAALSTLFNKFETAYAAHSRDETTLFTELGRELSDAQQRELNSLLRGLH